MITTCLHIPECILHLRWESVTAPRNFPSPPINLDIGFDIINNARILNESIRDMAGLSEETKSLIRDYTACGLTAELTQYARISCELQQEFCPETRAQLSFNMSQLDLATSQRGRWRHLYRGVERTKDGWEAYQVGDEILWPGYASATQDLRSAVEFSQCDERDPSLLGVIYEIFTPSGIEICSISDFANELECLLPRGKRFIIKDKQLMTAKAGQRGIVRLESLNAP